MKIYQIHELSGMWEDSCDFIVGSFLLKEKAIAEKARLENKEMQARKCSSCSLRFYNHNPDELKAICDKYVQEDEDTTMCVFHDYHEHCWYKLQEVEVIE